MTDEVPILQVAEAVEKTIADPSLPIIVEDIILAHDLASFVKAKLAGKRLGVKTIFDLLLRLAD